MRDSEFIHKLYVSTSGRLMKYIVHMCDDRTMAEDILQETYFEALLKKGRLEKHENATGWLYMTASYKVKNALRKRELQNVSIHVLLGEQQEPRSRDVGFGNCECWLTLESVLNKSEQNLVWQHYMLGYTWKEISVTDGISEGALRTQMSRIKRKLRSALGRDLKL